MHQFKLRYIYDTLTRTPRTTNCVTNSCMIVIRVDWNINTSGCWC